MCCREVEGSGFLLGVYGIATDICITGRWKFCTGGAIRIDQRVVVVELAAWHYPGQQDTSDWCTPQRLDGKMPIHIHFSKACIFKLLDSKNVRPHSSSQSGTCPSSDEWLEWLKSRRP